MNIFIPIMKNMNMICNLTGKKLNKNVVGNDIIYKCCKDNKIIIKHNNKYIIINEKESLWNLENITLGGLDGR